MTFSTAKSACVSEMSSKCGLVFDRAIEVADVDDLEKDIADTLGPKTTAGSKAAEMTHDKPQRPGQGKARIVAKFNPGDD